MRRGFWTSLEAGFCVVALSVFLGAYVTIPHRLQGVSLQGGESSPWNTAAMAIVLGGSLIVTALRWREFVFIARHGGAVNLFVLLALLSVLWSDAPAVSIRRWVSLAQAVAFAYYLVAAFPVERVIRFLAAAIGISMIASAWVALAFPVVGVMSEPAMAGSWTGVYGHKSHFGAVAVMGVMCFGWLWRNEPHRRPLHGAGVFLCVGMALMSQSRTAQLTILLVLSFSLFLPLLRLPGPVRLWAVYGMILTGAVFGGLLAAFFGDIMEALGKDASLTGRVPTWSSLLEVAAERPFGGRGYNAFFVLGNTDIQNVWRFTGWDMWSAHSAYIEIMLQLGVPGVVLAMWVILELIWCSLGEWTEGTLRWASFALVYTLVHAATSLVESSVFRGGDIVSLVLVLLLAALRVHSAARLAAGLAASPRPGRPIHTAYAQYR